jgi:hypothetical protein
VVWFGGIFYNLNMSEEASEHVEIGEEDLMSMGSVVAAVETQ